MTTAWSNYARCDECGVDAGKACRDEHDHEALEVCDGRELVIDDKVSRLESRRETPRASTRRDRPPSTTADTLYRRRTGRSGEPQYAPCQHCGALTRLWGAAVETGHTWCSKPDCKHAHKRVRINGQRARQRDRQIKARAASRRHDPPARV